jgi:hypothetical protein
VRCHTRRDRRANRRRTRARAPDPSRQRTPRHPRHGQTRHRLRRRARCPAPRWAISPFIWACRARSSWSPNCGRGLARPTPVVVGERLGYADEQIRHVTAADLPALDMETPSVFLVGVRTFPSQQFTLFTGTDPDHFLRHGPLLHWPMIELASLPLAERQARLNAALPTCDGLLFPSRFAVQSFMETLLAERRRPRSGRQKIARRRTRHGAGIATTTACARMARPTTWAGARPGPQARKPVHRPLSVSLLRCRTPGRARGQPARTRHRTGAGGVLRKPGDAVCELPRLPFDRVLFTSTTTVQAYFRRYPLELEQARTWLAVGPPPESVAGTGPGGGLAARRHRSRLKKTPMKGSNA